MRVFVSFLAFAQAAHLMAAVTGNVQLQNSPSASPAERAFHAAARSFQSGNWATAARWFEEFAAEYPESPMRAEATLLRAQALYQIGAYNKAATEISRNEKAAGPLADAYLYWKAECRLRMEQYDAAAAHLQELLRAHPKSGQVLAANVALATVSAKKSDWANVVQLLRPTEGEFQRLAKAAPNSAWAQEGRLLLAQALFELQDWTTAAEELGRLPASVVLHREWRRLFLLAKLEHQAGKTKEALMTTARVAELAHQAGLSGQLAQVHCFHAEIHAANGDVPSALKAYARLQAPEMPAAFQRESFLRIAQLHLKQKNFSASIKALDELTGLKSGTNFLGVIHCMAGELEWQNHRNGTQSALARAKVRFSQAAISNTPQIKGRAKWGEGMCFMAEGNKQAAQDSWIQAADLLSDSAVHPWVCIQLAHAQVKAGKHSEARTMLGVGMPEELKSFVQFLALQNALALKEFSLADSLLGEKAAGNSKFLDQSILALLQARVDAGQFSDANLVLTQLRESSPDSPLQADAELEIIRGLVAKADWAAASAAYLSWLSENKNHPLHAKIMFDFAWAHSMQSNGNADKKVEAAFEEITKVHPDSVQSHFAKMWMADFAYNSGTNHLGAEKMYKSISNQTNAPPKLRNRATLMAGRAAMARQGFAEARREFTRLINHQNAANEIKLDAHFALGDLTMLEIGAAVPDAISKLSDATNSFYNVVQASPTNALGARAWGRIGDCCLLASSKEPGYREHARIAYEKSINIPGPMPVALKSQTRLGLAKVLVQQAAGSDGGEKKITKAVDHLLAVIHGRHLQPGQVQDVYWRAQCCLMAMDLLGQLGKPREALEICNLMKREFPAMQSGLEKRKQQLLDQLTKIK